MGRKGLTIKRWIAALECAALIGVSCVSFQSVAGEENVTETEEEATSSESSSESVSNVLEQDNHTMVIYNSQNGMPASEANDIAQSEEGFIWIATYSGLLRYDGKDFYEFPASSGITSVASLLVDSKNRLWVGTNDKGVARYEDGEFTFWDDNDGLNSGSIKDMVEDENGNIILATTEGLAYINENDEVKMIEDESVDTEYIFDLDVDSEGTVYGTTTDNKIFELKDLNIVMMLDASDYGITDLDSVSVSNEIGQIYVGSNTNDILVLDMNLDGKKMNTIKAGHLSNVNRVVYVADDCKVVCADNGIGYLDKKNHFKKIENDKFDNSIDNILIDYEGNYWFTSSHQGVMKISASRFENITATAGIEEVVYNTICPYDNCLYMGTDNGLVITTAFNYQKENELTEYLKGVRIRAIKEDSEGRLWICTYGDKGLVCYHKDGTIVTYNEEDGLNSAHVRTVMETKDGRIVVATSAGVNVLKDDKVAESYGVEEGITNPEILSICEGDDGSLYFGSDGAGIFHLTGNVVEQFNHDDGLESDVVMKMVKEPDSDRIWIVTGNSIAYMEEDKITTIQSMPYTNNYDLFFYGDNVWILNSNGVVRVNKEDFVNDRIESYDLFNDSLGMPCSPTANARNCISDGKLYVAGTSDAYSIDLDSSVYDETLVKMAIPFIEVDGKYLYADSGETIRVPATATRVTFNGFILSSALGDPTISYQLKGFDEESTMISRSELDPISYTNLAGGSYDFELNLLSEDGNVVKTETLHIIKTKKLVEQPWFIIALILTTLIFAIGFSHVQTRRKTKKLIAKQERDERIITEVIRAFSIAIDRKDQYTNGHSSRVAEYSRMLAKKLKYSEQDQNKIYKIALLHDVGKILVPDEVLCKPSRLTDEEYAIIKKHTVDGYEILKEITDFPDISLGAKYHHERLDGKGYPDGIKSEEIPYIAKIIAVADTFDAMNSTRTYRKKMDRQDVIAELRRVKGTQLDPDIVEALIEIMDQIE